MASPLMLEGRTDNRDIRIKQLESEVHRLESEMRTQRAGVAELQRILSPLYLALKKIYGEIETIGDVVETAHSPVNNQKWELWKQRFPGRGAKLIEVLLVQQQLNTKQLSAALQCDPRTLAQLIYKMKGAGLIRKSANNLYSLSEL